VNEVRYRILAAGPIIRGHGCLPHRVVLVKWDDEISTHMQCFEPSTLCGFAYSSLTEGKYYQLDSQRAMEGFLHRTKVHVNVYGKDVDFSVDPENYPPKGLLQERTGKVIDHDSK
jgi:hypothetical protein